MRMIRVIGSETSSAWLRSWLTTWLTAWPPEAVAGLLQRGAGMRGRRPRPRPAAAAPRAHRHCRDHRAAAPARVAACRRRARGPAPRAGPGRTATLGSRRARTLERLDRRAGALSAAGADQHALGRRRLEMGGGQRGIGPSRLAGARAARWTGSWCRRRRRRRCSRRSAPATGRRWSAGGGPRRLRSNSPPGPDARTARLPEWEAKRGFLMLASLPTGRSRCRWGAEADAPPSTPESPVGLTPPSYLRPCAHDRAGIVGRSARPSRHPSAHAAGAPARRLRPPADLDRQRRRAVAMVGAPARSRGRSTAGSCCATSPRAPATGELLAAASTTAARWWATSCSSPSSITAWATSAAWRSHPTGAAVGWERR